MIAAVEGHDVVRVRAGNPSPLTLDGSNTWVLGRDPAWVVDPGPDMPEHLRAVAAVVGERGGAGGIVLTHDHPDHSEGAASLSRLLGGAEVRGMRTAPGRLPLAGGDEAGPLHTIALPGHADDHLVFVAGAVCFSGDAVLGAGSVFVAGDMAGYLDGLRRLRALALDVICPGHGPPVTDPAARLDEYLTHRLDRERRLVEALGAGLRSDDDLLDVAWSDAPAVLRAAALLTMHAHMRKLAAEGRLPEGMQAPPQVALPHV